MAGNLRLRLVQNFNQVADANLLVAHQIQESEPGIVAKCLEEPFEIERLFSGHV